MIKSFLWVFVAVACCVCYFMGLSSGLQTRLILAGLERPPVVSPVSRELKCTCVPCLPDLYCIKCGHKSRDCPKLRDYFSKRGGVGGVASSNAVQSVKSIAPGA